MIDGLERLPCRFRSPYTFRLRLDRLQTPAGDPVEVTEKIWTEADHWEFLEWAGSVNEYGLDSVPAMAILTCQPLRAEFVAEIRA